MFTKKIPLYYLVVSSALAIVITYVFLFYRNKNTDTPPPATTKQDCNTYIARLHGYKYVNKLLYAERSCESQNFDPLKEEITNYIENEKRSGKLTQASVYIRVYTTSGEWLTINPEEQYHPASLLKLPVLFTFARMAETNPKILDEKVLFRKHDTTLPKQIYVSKTLQPGNTYTIRELLKYLISYSDNDALYLLYNYHDPAVYKKIFTDLDLPILQGSRDDADMKVKEYSILLRVLYNGTYLSTSSSEYALSLLAQSDFKDGILKGVPPNIEVAHKFGEYFRGNVFELHESAIVYASKYNYVITVMTRGSEMKELSDVVGNISKMTYDNLQNNSSIALTTKNQ